MRLAYFNEYKDSSVYPVLTASDSHSYYLWAQDIKSGQLLGDKVFMKWPLYAYFLALFLKITGNNIAIIHHLQFLLGIAHCIVVYFIGLKLFNRRVGFLAALLCSFYGLFIFFLLLGGSLIIYQSRKGISSKIKFWFTRMKKAEDSAEQDIPQPEKSNDPLDQESTETGNEPNDNGK